MCVERVFPAEKLHFFGSISGFFLTYFTVRLSDCGKFEARLTGQKHFYYKQL